MAVDGKKKGGAYERKVAKELSFWLFDGDYDVLKRHPTSGADKCIWCGDIVPMKQLPDKWNKHFPFVVECKSGYDQHSPTFWTYTKVEQWFKKALLEGQINNQHILLLICQFKNKSPLLITNIHLPMNLITPNVIIPIINNGEAKWGFVYQYSPILKLNYEHVFQGCALHGNTDK